QQHVPQRQRVFAARHGDQHALTTREHLVTADRLAHLIAEEIEEVRRAEGRVVASQLERRGAATLAALHAAPPDITGRSSITSSSRSIWSAVTSSSPRITTTVWGRMSSSRRMSLPRRLPATWTSRRGLRSTTFMLSARGTPVLA